LIRASDADELMAVGAWGAGPRSADDPTCDYVGSVTFDTDLLDAAGLLPGQ